MLKYRYFSKKNKALISPAVAELFANERRSADALRSEVKAYLDTYK